MKAGEWARALFAGLVAGLAGGLFGVGGGLVLIPLLTGWFRLSQHQAHGTSLAVIGATAVAALVVYGANAHVAWGTALVVGVASALAAPLGARLAARTSSRHLRLGFAAYLVIMGLRLLWAAPHASAAALHQGFAMVMFDLLLGGAVGVLAGYMGVGGGVLAVPAFTLLLGMQQQMAQGTSLAVILIAAPAGALEHARHGNVIWRVVPALAIGAAAGALAASWLVQGLPHDLLVRIFALFLLANAALTFLRRSKPEASPPLDPAPAPPGGAGGP